MPNTRHQNPQDRYFRQDAFASSAEFERGVLGNLVAARCQKLSDPEEIAMLWWLQKISWMEGGLERFAWDLAVKYRSRISIFRIDYGPGREWFDGREIDAPDPDDREIESMTTFLSEALVNPSSSSLRANPARMRDGVTKFSGLWDALCALRRSESETARGRIVDTAIARQIFEELDFARETRSFVLIEGREGIGKSEAARAWCDQHPGQAIYVRLEAGSDEVTLYRAIARQIGTACSYARKAVEMRARIQDALQPGHLMLVLDEAHFLWPQSQRYQGSVPKRLDWLRTALVDYSVPIALISTPQYFAHKCDQFRRVGWNANQIQRRLTRVAQLPEALSAEDALAIAKHCFPSAPVRAAKRIAGMSLLTLGYLGTIASLRKRVDFLASRRPGVAEPALIELALTEIAAPSGMPVQAASKPTAKPLPAVCRGAPDAVLRRSSMFAREQPAFREGAEITVN